MTEALLDITAIGRRGEGVARHDGAAVFVPLCLPGETVRAAIEGERGLLQEIVRPSPDRAAAFCPHYGTCGGCQLQHWRDEPYRNWKAGLVEAALRNRGLSGTVRELIDAHGSGRRRVSIHVRRKDGVVTAGFMAARSHNLLDLDHCPILVPELGPAFDLARTIGVKLGDCDVALTALQGGIDASVRAERKIVAEEHRGLAAFAAKLPVARFSVNGEVILTPHTPFATMGKALVPVPPGSFLQATAEGEEVLARLVCEAMGKSKHVADLFCGCGPFAFRLAERARVQAFDSDRPAIAALNAAARVATGLKPITATARDLFREPLVAMELKEFDAVVFDPPRAGAEAQAKQLAKSKVKTVAAVSCDAASFARDAEILIGGGYALTSLTAVDQFKWTSHVEIVAGFRKA
jgi:23S rRNA (uracil1939-C5)-methyltransferase